MPRVAFRVMTCYMALVLSGCGASEPPWVEIASSKDLQYITRLKTFDSEGHADSPIDLSVSPKTEPSLNILRLKTSQCESVEVVAAPDYLYIFYVELALSFYGSKQHYNSLPRAFLCDLEHPMCRALRSSLLSEGRVVTDVCTHKPNGTR